MAVERWPFFLWIKQMEKSTISQTEIHDINGVRTHHADFNYFEKLPVERRTETVSMAAVIENPQNLHLVPEPSKTDTVILAALGEDGMLLAQIENEKITREMCQTAVEDNGLALKYVPKEFVDTDLAIKALANDPFALAFVPDELKTEGMCRIAFEAVRFPYNEQCYNILADIPFAGVLKEILDHHGREIGGLESGSISRDAASNILSKFPYFENSLPEHVKTDEMYLGAMNKGSTDILQHIPSEKRNPEICLYATMVNPEMKNHVPDTVAQGRNIYSFHNDLSKVEGLKDLNFHQVKSLYNGDQLILNFNGKVGNKDLNGEKTVKYDEEKDKIVIGNSLEENRSQSIENQQTKSTKMKM